MFSRLMWDFHAISMCFLGSDAHSISLSMSYNLALFSFFFPIPLSLNLALEEPLFLTYANETHERN